MLPPYQEDLLAQYGVDPVAASQGHWSPYSMTATPTGRSWTRTFTAPDGTVITEVPSSTVLYRGVTFSPKKWGRGTTSPSLSSVPSPLELLHPFRGLFSTTTWYQRGKASLDLNEARDDGVLGWQMASAGPYANNLHHAPAR